MDTWHDYISSGMGAWILGSTNTYLVITDSEGIITFSNDHFKHTFRGDSSNETNILFKEHIPEEEFLSYESIREKCMGGDPVVPVPFIVKVKVKGANHYKSVQWECSLISLNDGEKLSVLHIGRDMVAVERENGATKNYRKTLNNLIDNLQIGVVVQNEKSSILLSNTKAEELLGLTKDQLYGRTASDESWHIIHKDGSEFKPEDLPTARAIATREYQEDVILGVFNPRIQEFKWLQVDAKPEYDEYGNIDQVVTTFIDITQRVKGEEELKRHQMQLQIMMDYAPLVIFMKHVNGEYSFFNQMYKDFMDQDLIPGMTDYDIFEKDFADWCKAKDQEVINDDRILNFEHHVNGEIFIETKFPIKDNDGKVYAIGGFSQNITKQKKEEELLRLQESVITHAKDAVIITKPDSEDKDKQVITFANQAFYDMTGYEAEDILGKSPRMLEGESTDPVELEKLYEAIKKGIIHETEIINYKKNGEKYWVNFGIAPVKNKEGTITHWISVQQDVTKRVEYEQELEEALREKTFLLSEVHHRVKNNLAIVSGLLELQSMELDMEYKLPLQRSINRIHSIAMVHELMYQTEKLSSVNIKDYLDKLIPAIQRTMQTKNDVEINLALEDYEMNINQAIPLGLLINELLTNSFKYAFLKQFDGRIDILMKVNQSSLEFTYKDNGQGFKEGTHFDKKTSMGLNLIHAQLEQLHADFTVITENRFELSFKFEISGRGPHSNI